MEYTQIIEKFIPAIEESFPLKTNYSSEIAKILGLSVRTASRKLKGEIQFSTSEVMTLSRKLNISLDSITMKNNKNMHTMFLSNYDWGK